MIAAGDRPQQSACEDMLLDPEFPRGRPALFLDRDGVLIEETGYARDPAGVRLERGAATLVRRANEAGIAVVVVTNQSGIGRGLLDWADYRAVTARMLGDLAGEGAHVQAVYACPFHAEAAPPYRAADHPDRKPAPGMILRAGKQLGLELARSWIVGDSARDLDAGKAAGLAGGIHVLCGHGAGERQAVLRSSPAFRVLLAEDVVAAARLLPMLGQAAKQDKRRGQV